MEFVKLIDRSPIKGPLPELSCPDNLVGYAYYGIFVANIRKSIRMANWEWEIGGATFLLRYYCR